MIECAGGACGFHYVGDEMKSMQESQAPKHRRSFKRRIPEALDIAPLNGVLNQLRGVIEVELLLDMCAMGFDRLYAQVKLLGDLSRALALADHVEYFQF